MYRKARWTAGSEPDLPFAGSPRFSAATSHEQNDAYMQEFDTAYAELEAMSLANS